MKIIKLVYFFINISFCLLAPSGVLLGQGLCDDKLYDKSNFELNLAEVCGSQEVVATNKSADTDIRYVFDYRGESLLDALENSKPAKSHTYTLQYQPQVFTVLQIGQRLGKTTVACKNVSVRPSNTPVHSYTICGNSVEFVVPPHPLNNFDKYTLNVGNGGSPINFTKADLPYRITRTANLPVNYAVVGSYNDPSRNCTNPVATQVIPARSLISDYPHHPNIGKVELLSLTKVKIEYNGPHTQDNSSSYSLYTYKKNEYNKRVEIKKNIVPGIYEFSIPDSSKSYCYVVSKNQACNGLFDESGEICTLPIYFGQHDAVKQENIISWVEYPITQKGFALPPFGTLSNATYNTKQELVIWSGANIANKIIPALNQNEYKHGPIKCLENTSYRLKQEVVGTYRFNKFMGVSISNRFYIHTDTLTPPSMEDLWVSTETKNRVYMSKKLDVWPKAQWFLYKKDNNRFVVVDSVAASGAYLEDAISPTKTESYKLSYKDQCGRLARLSHEVESIFLSFDGLKNVNWTDSRPFSDDEIIKTELVALDENLENTILSVDQALNNFSINIDDIKGPPELRLKIVSYGNKRVSSSNIIMVIKPLTLFVPNVFTPNNDGFNDLLEIKGFEENIKSMSLKIYNRNGELLRQINSLDETWDGKYRNEELMFGNYPYLLELEFLDSSKRKISGDVLLIR